tara:strand:- start:714 stop:1025 length:312 start_codon:yes stop_codon:yes gene_type:complete
MKLRKIVVPVSSSMSTAITGSIYKVCSNGAAGSIESASFGRTSQLEPTTPVADLNFVLHYNNNAGDTCIEADFTYVSCSLVARPNNVLVYLKTNGGDWSTRKP